MEYGEEQYIGRQTVAGRGEAGFRVLSIHTPLGRNMPALGFHPTQREQLQDTVCL